MKPLALRVYWHLWLHHNWRKIFAEQRDLLVTSGISEACESISVSVVGEPAEIRELELGLGELPKARIVARGFYPGVFEFPAIQACWEDAQTQDGAALYMHAKGVSYLDDQMAAWRDAIHNVIREWRMLLRELETHEVAGQNYLPYFENRWPAHFSGNFWIGRQDYLRKLIEPIKFNPADRMNAEWWVCTGSPKVFALPWVDHDSISAALRAKA